VPYASNSQYGVVKTGYSENGKNYAVQTDANGKMYVSVPWDDDTNTNWYHTPSYAGGLCIATGTGLNDLYVPVWARTAAGYAPGLVPDPGSVTAGDSRFLCADGSWRDPDYPTYTLPTASATTKGGIKVGTCLSISNAVLSVTANSSSSAGYVASGSG
jgi:hypothetical protein